MKQTVLIALSCLLTILPVSAQNTAKTRIGITAGKAIITAELDNSQTTEEFLSLLPCTITMKRWNNREFYGSMGKRLSEDGEKIPDFTNGDVTYYIPGGSLTLFYANDDKSNLANLIRMGKITSDLRTFEQLPDSVNMRIKIAEDIFFENR